MAVYSQAEVQPTHFFEALWFGKPLIHNNASLLQTVASHYLDIMIKDFGMNALDFDDAWAKCYHSGNGSHFLDAWSFDVKDFAKAVLYYYSEEKRREEYAKSAREWVSSWWTMEEKCGLLVDMMKERKYIG